MGKIFADTTKTGDIAGIGNNSYVPQEQERYTTFIPSYLYDETSTPTSTSTNEDDGGFVKIDNEMKCSEVDLFYINVKNISELCKYCDIDGFYKIDISFVDGSDVQFEYISEDTMEKDYKTILKYFENKSGGIIIPVDDGDSDSDSD